MVWHISSILKDKQMLQNERTNINDVSMYLKYDGVLICDSGYSFLEMGCACYKKGFL